ncbi:MAG: recombinase family protein [Eubacterium sp.]|nr:recombinase family protein [Clostridia bacterium]MCI8957415.1 recombinase family protein [Eubacterium sp.]
MDKFNDGINHIETETMDKPVVSIVSDEENKQVDENITDTANEWEKRRNEREAERERIRSRVRNSIGNNEYFIPAKPNPSITEKGSKIVAAYTRVSTNSMEQVSSVENQTKYYEKKISENPDWTLSEIYSDEGKSGTSLRHRDAFKRMMQDAKDKKMDLILCASISRFARNISDCIEQLSLLKTMNPNHPVGVYFETENIYSLDDRSNDSLEMQAMLADWESKNKSRRMILSYDQRILTGQYPVADLLGYRHTTEGELVIVPEEALTVRFVFLAYIDGMSCDDIAKILTEHKRPTLKGRVDWNRDMVWAIMGNERRWGDLEARKTIVIDYKHGVVAKNNNRRDAAYVPQHHEGIVTPDIAKAVRLLSESSRKIEGIPDTVVIENGALKGFVSTHPGWKGINHEVFVSMCRSAYTDDELAELDKTARIRAGKEHSDVLSLNFTGYQVAPGIVFLNNTMPSLTITPKSLKFNKVCHERFNNCNYIEIFYHPILQMIIIRESAERFNNSVEWVTSNGKNVASISSKAFSKAIYDGFNWNADYNFKFRGITKQRGMTKFIVFNLDEPQILMKKKIMGDITASNEYVNHNANDKTTYISDWNKERVRFSYELHQKRDEIINSITEHDILEKGVTAVNPILGDIPSREMLSEELTRLLECM